MTECSILEPVVKNTQAQWINGSTLNNISTDARPDALSPDYRIAYAYGPVETGSLDNGLVHRVWKVSVEDSPLSGTVFLQRETDSRDGYRPTLPLFTYDSSYPIEEIDLSFTGDGRPIVCAARRTAAQTASLSGSEIWLYWFNPFQSTYAFEKFDTGKTPRIILDSPENPSESDILLMYVRDEIGHVYYRQQRTQYSGSANFIPLPIPSSVSGTLQGALQGTLIGSLTGSSEGLINGYLSGIFTGQVFGTGSGTSTGSIDLETRGYDTFKGSMFGTLNGRASGSMSGTLNGNVFIGASSSLSGTLLGEISGTMSGSYNGYVYRPRNYMFSGSFNGLISGSLTGSLEGSSYSSKIYPFLNGYASGSLSGAMAGEIYGIPTGSQQAYFETFLEDVVKLRDSRIRILYSQRNILTNLFATKSFETVLYPVTNMIENFSSSLELSSIDVRDLIINVPYALSESFNNFSLSVLTGSLFDTVISKTFPDRLAFNSFSLSILIGSLFDAVMIRNNEPPESFTSFSLSIRTGSLDTTTIVYNSNHGDDHIKNIACSFVSFSLS